MTRTYAPAASPQVKQDVQPITTHADAAEKLLAFERAPVADSN